MVRIKDFENYFITRDGRVFNEKTGKFRKNRANRYGYIFVNLSKNGINKIFTIHRLLAISYIPNPENKPCVNHINCKKGDNRLENLEWVTYSENTIHAFKNNLYKPKSGGENGRAVKVIDTKTFKIYDTVLDAANEFKIDPSYLTRMLKGKRRNQTNLKYYNK